jgi:hypothetical protein
LGRADCAVKEIRAASATPATDSADDRRHSATAIEPMTAKVHLEVTKPVVQLHRRRRND